MAALLITRPVVASDRSLWEPINDMLQTNAASEDAVRNFMNACLSIRADQIPPENPVRWLSNFHEAHNLNMCVSVC